MKPLGLNNVGLAIVLLIGGWMAGDDGHAVEAVDLEAANPLLPIPDPPLGIGGEKNPPATLLDLDDPPTPQTVRLGRWLFFDKRLSADNTVSCATCHPPVSGFASLPLVLGAPQLSLTDAVFESVSAITTTTRSPTKRTRSTDSGMCAVR